MLRSANEIFDYVLEATDGEIGRCKDFLFDDRHWGIRYMVADTGKWLPGRKLLVSPISLGEADWASRTFRVKLTRQQLEDSPPLEQDAPVSRQYETRWFDYYRWPYYWVGGDVWGANPYPAALYAQAQEELKHKKEQPEKTHVRSVKEVTGYHIKARDGEIGHVEDFILDDQAWTLRYMVVDTRNWLPGRKVLVAPAWITSVNWAESEVGVDLTTEAIKNSPVYDPSTPVNREYEVRLYDFYGRPRYWE